MSGQSDNYLEINDSKRNDRLFESVFKRILSDDKWLRTETQQEIEDSKDPAFCLKTRDLTTGEKIFINFCHSSMMKTPTLDLNEEELQQLLATEEADSFTIPLILTQFKPSLDKSGSKAQVLDVIINTEFYKNKIRNSKLFQTFLITVTLETIESKHKIQIEKNNWILLKNKKYQKISNKMDINYDKIGDEINDLSALLNSNVINNGNEIDDNKQLNYEFVKTSVNNNKLIQYVNNTNKSEDIGHKSDTTKDSGYKRPKTKIIGNNNSHNEDEFESNDYHLRDNLSMPTITTTLNPRYKLSLNVFDNCLEAHVMLSSIVKTKQIVLDIGEDRIVLNADKYQLDIFVPILIHTSHMSATFDGFTHILKIKMPIIY
ncbi:PIH1 domain-containing protein 1-like isoform X1 [Oppia nitens]|uniref:PIH1 domain-containing protein 1-like isoform X1 n=1 Tax=Oppia nitens TaxID=1686743 RepID=UPI0023DAE249|nr:PIH1 domain-containing protein 1-like isoform X1 [Oppia nitens]